MSYVLEHKSQRRPAPPKPMRLWNGERLAGNAILAFWLASFVFLAWWLVASWDSEFFNRYSGRYINGVLVTLGLVALSLILGAVLSVPIAFMRMSKNKLLNKIAFGYIYFFRGTPLITQLFLVYYGLGSFRAELESVGLWGFFREAWNCALFAFSLNTAAYQAEILRGAIESVPKGQWEGAKALGLNKFQIYLKIITPQALLVALRPYGNEVILMLKASAIVSIVTVFDLMGETRRAFSKSFDFQTYIYAAILYLMIVEVLRNFIDFVEKRITKHLKR
ncbi:MAG: ABC transporter permease [Nitratireductor sp.]